MSVCVVHGQNGGAGLAVKVVGGTQKPSNGKQGIIWVNTDQKITSWTMQDQEPAEPSEGMVWVGILTSAKLNALKKNGLWFTPKSAKQYIAGAWVKKEGEYYNNGQWAALLETTISITYPAGAVCTVTDGTSTLMAPDTSGFWECYVPNTGTWTVTLDSGFAETVDITANGETHTIDKWYLYKRGEICNINVIGGLGLYNYTYGKNCVAATFNSNHIVLSGNAGSCFAGTKNAIDISKFTKLCAVGKGQVAGAFVSKVTSSFTARSSFPASEGDTSIDLSGYSGAYYLGLQCTTTGTAYAYELYLQ